MNGLESARLYLAEARRVAALTGAGISAESGVPTFRGPGGLWRNFRPEELATPEAFARDPLLVWEWYQWRRSKIAEVEPNAGHLALAELERRDEGFQLITQNVDGLHDRAGSQSVLKVHGDIWILQCTGCGRQRMDRRLEFDAMPPVCGDCGALLRPGVVWFGEPLPRLVFDDAVRAAQGCDLLLVCGTSAQVYPAAGLIDVARRGGARVVEINIESTPYSASVDLALQGPCGELLPALIGMR